MSSHDYSIAGPCGRLAGWFRPPAHGGPPSAGPAIVLVHGMHQSCRHWDRLADHLPDDRAILAPEYRGHGNSDCRGPHGLDHYVDDVLRAIDHHGLDEVHLVGTSFGGSLAVAAAAALGDRARSVLALAASRTTGKDRDVGQVVQLLRDRGVRAFFAYTVPRFTLPPGTPEAVVAAHVDAVVAGRDVDTVAAVFEGTYGTDVAPRAEQVRCPALVVSGALDRTCPPSSGRELAAALGCDHQVLDGAAHVPAIERPAEVAALLLAHIARAEVTDDRAASRP